MKLFDVYPLYEVTPVRAKDVYVYDNKGTEYLDLYGGHSVISIGHGHPHYIERLTQQMHQIGFYSNAIQNPLQQALADAIGEHSCCHDYQLFLCSSGAEANENALKLASFHTGKKRVIAFNNAFHGRTSAAVAATDNPAINAAEDFVNAGYPREAAALLIIELDGPEAEVEVLINRVSEIVKASGASSIRISQSEEERNQFWAGRKSAFPAVGRISPDYLCMDGTIPRRALPEMLTRMSAMSQKFGLCVANVFHAGDGNLHPLILFDANADGELHRAEEFGAEILRNCVALGGVLTGEHGVGVEKRDLMTEMFTDDDLKQQQRLKCAFDPQHLLNPGKVFPVLHRCAELGRLHVHQGKLPHPDIPRF